MTAKQKNKKPPISIKVMRYFGGVGHSCAVFLENIRQRHFPGPKKLSSVCVCVDFWDKLKITLPLNKRHFDETIVVTSIKDVRTKAICKKHNVKCIVTDSFFENGAKFNKANGINKALAAVSLNDWVCIWDADTLLPENFRETVNRYCRDVEAIYCGMKPLRLETKKKCLNYIRKRAQQPWGYCQIYHYGSHRDKAYEEHYKTAAWSDYRFRYNFARHYIFQENFCHLGPQQVNWEGKIDEYWLTRREVAGVLLKERIKKICRTVVPGKKKKDGRKKLSAVMICVGYWDKLAITLPVNRKHFDEIIVVTSTEDTVTREICGVFDVNCIVTDCFYEDRASFNKAKGINLGLEAVSLDDWVCLCDVDTIYPDNFRDIFEKRCIASNVLYGSNSLYRWVLDRKEDYLRYLREKEKPLICKDIPWGYCQVYNYRFNEHKRYDGKKYRTAFLCDREFVKTFHEKKRFRFKSAFWHLGFTMINRGGRIEPFWGNEGKYKYTIDVKTGHSGFCDRVRPVITGFYLMDKLGPQARMAVNWDRDAMPCQYDFADLFAVPEKTIFTSLGSREDEVSIRIKYDDAALKRCEDVVSYVKVRLDLKELQDLLSLIDGWNAHSREPRFDVGYKVADGEIILTLASDHDRYPDLDKRRCYRYLRPAPKLRHRIDSLRKEFAVSRDVIGVHVGSTDKNAVNGPGLVEDRIGSVRSQMGGILKENPAQRFLFCAEDKSIVDRFIGWFGDNLIVIPGKHYVESTRLSSDRTKEYLEDAVVELWLLSMCDYNKKLKMHYYSSFTKLLEFLKMTFRDFIGDKLYPDEFIRGAAPTDGKAGYVPWPIGIYPNIKIKDVEGIPQATNELLCYCNVREWCSYGTEKRKKVLRNVYGKDFVTFEGRSDPATRHDHGKMMNARSYFASMVRHKFVISPEGLGEDTHRIYEAIICKAIPIIQYNERIVEKYRGLPVLVTENDYVDITEELLNRKYEEILETEYDFDKLREGYWVERHPQLKINSRFWQTRQDSLKDTEGTNRLTEYIKRIGKDIIITTAVTNGCIEMVSNWFAALKRSGLADRAFAVGLDDQIIVQLEDKGIPCVFWKSALYEPKDKLMPGFKDGWMELNMAKLDLIHTIISKGQTLLYSNSDVVFLGSPLEELREALVDKEVVFQTEAKSDNITDRICMGFLCAKKTDNTIRLFDAVVTDDEKENIQPLNKEFEDGVCDQALVQYRLKEKYLEKMKRKIGILDPYVYPNGRTIDNSPEFDINRAKALHFNGCSSKAHKIDKMKASNVWYV